MIFKGLNGPFYLTNDTKILFFEAPKPPYNGKTNITIPGFNILVEDTLEEVAEIIRKGHEEWQAEGKIV